MRGHRINKIAIALIVVSLLALGFIWHTQRVKLRQPRGQRQHLQYGEVSPIVIVHDVGGQKIRFPQPGRYNLLLFSNPQRVEGIRLMRYLNILHERYREKGLNCITITKSSDEKLLEALQRGHPLVVDKSGDLHARFGFSPEVGGILIVGPDGIVRFAYHWLGDADLLRQLVEKFVLGHVNVALGQIDTTLFQSGEEIPAIKAIELSQGTDMWLSSDTVGKAVVVVFTAGCASCQLQHFIRQLKGLEQKSQQANGRGLVALFSQSFSREEVLAHVRGEGITVPVYLATQGLEGLEDPYNTRYDVMGPGPLVVRTDTSGRIVNVTPVDKFLKEGIHAIH